MQSATSKLEILKKVKLLTNQGRHVEASRLFNQHFDWKLSPSSSVAAQ